MILLPITPVPKPRMTVSDRWKKRPIVIKYRKYCDALRAETEKQKFQITNPLSIVFVIPMPKSWSKKKKMFMDSKPHCSRPDLDNLIKAFQDALAEEDSHIHTYGKMHKMWGYEGKIIIIDYI
jgi:Holliday junction resolvase RusA-like endonuclease